MAGYYEPGSQYGDRPRQSQEQVQREPHLLNLKVLRASRPSFTQSKDIFRDETSSQQSASTSGFTLTPLLALPTAFGNINLGETFQGLIVAANDSSEEIFDASLRIEIQTANSRTTLWESPPPKKDNPSTLKPGDSLEAPLLRYEIKEPGLHALSCSVSYWAQTRNLSFTPQPGAGERHMRSFKKLYKFQASNPLAVKTKIHTSRNAAAQLDEDSERTAFLEVQIQNTSPEALHLEQLQFNPSDHQEVEDLTAVPTGQLQPGDLLQCLYIVKSGASHYQELLEKAKHAGGNLSLGKLDIRWRSHMGDSGHLATSQLVRRLPQHMLPPALSRSPSMQSMKGGLNALQTPDKRASNSSRDHSPIHSPQTSSAASFSPAVSPRQLQMEFQRHHVQSKDLTASLVVLPFGSRSVLAGRPFDVKFKLSLTSVMRGLPDQNGTSVSRQLNLAVQHVVHAASIEHEVAPAAPDQGRLSLDSHAPNEATPLQSARGSMETDRPLPAIVLPHERLDLAHGGTMQLPPPRPLAADHPFFYPSATGPSSAILPDAECRFYGSSLTILEPLIINNVAKRPTSNPPDVPETEPQADADTRSSIESTSTTDEVPLEEMMRLKSAKRTQTIVQEFSLQYVASTAGIFKLGGVRILLLKDIWFDGSVKDETHSLPGLPPCTLLEHNVVAEVRVEL